LNIPNEEWDNANTLNKKAFENNTTSSEEIKNDIEEYKNGCEEYKMT